VVPTLSQKARKDGGTLGLFCEWKGGPPALGRDSHPLKIRKGGAVSLGGFRVIGNDVTDEDCKFSLRNPALKTAKGAAAKVVETKDGPTLPDSIAI
jgi:hypothetical protein